LTEVPFSLSDKAQTPSRQVDSARKLQAFNLLPFSYLFFLYSSAPVHLPGPASHHYAPAQIGCILLQIYPSIRDVFCHLRLITWNNWQNLLAYVMYTWIRDTLRPSLAWTPQFLRFRSFRAAGGVHQAMPTRSGAGGDELRRSASFGLHASL